MSRVTDHQSNIGQVGKDNRCRDMERVGRIYSVPRQTSHGASPSNLSGSKVDGRALVVNWKSRGNRAVANVGRVLEVRLKTRTFLEVFLGPIVARNGWRGVCNQLSTQGQVEDIPDEGLGPASVTRSLREFSIVIRVICTVYIHIYSHHC